MKRVLSGIIMFLFAAMGRPSIRGFNWSLARGVITGKNVLKYLVLIKKSGMQLKRNVC
jgi:hypothetical protein